MKQSLELVDREQAYGLRAAVEVLKSAPVTKFDESVDLAVNLGVDPKHADQMVRGGIVLPHGTGKTMRILVFAKGDKEKEAQAAGADHVGADDLAKRIQEGWLDFDRVIHDADGVAAPWLVPARGLCRTQARHRDDGRGTVAEQSRKGRIPRREGRHRPRSAGKKSFSVDQLVDNATALIDAWCAPISPRGRTSEDLDLTMGPPAIDPSSVEVTKVA
jgi:large subunit ribosomal protein L1